MLFRSESASATLKNFKDLDNIGEIPDKLVEYKKRLEYLIGKVDDKIKLYNDGQIEDKIKIGKYVSDLVQNPKFKFEKRDICKLNRLVDCDYFINIAAETHVDNSIRKSDDFVHSNIVGVHNILELLKNYKKEGYVTPTLLHFSTDEVYGDISEIGRAHV